MNIGDKVKITYGEFQGRVGQIKARHMNPIPSEMKKIRAGVTITSRHNETLYSVLLRGDKDVMCFPKSCLKPVSD